MASNVIKVPVGKASVVQITEGVQPGLMLCWKDPRGNEPALLACIAADRPGVAIPTDVDEVWIEWPAVLGSTVPVTLRSWSTPPPFVPPPWERYGRAECELLAVGRGVTITVGDNPLYDSRAEDDPVDFNRAAGDVELRRWSALVAYVMVENALVPSSSFNLSLLLFQGGDWWYAFNSPGARNQVWQDKPTGETPVGRIASVVFPYPFCPWKLSIFHESITSTEASYHLYRTTAALARITI